MSKFSFNALKKINLSDLVSKSIPQELFKKVKVLTIIVGIFAIGEMLFRLMDASLLQHLSSVISFVVIKFTDLIMLFSGNHISVDFATNTILVNDYTTSYFSSGMFGLRYYFVAIVLFYMYERKLSKRLWLILGSYFLFVLTSAVLLNYRLLGDKYLLFYYNFINETIITILLIMYLIWKAIEIHKNRTKDEVYKFLHNSTFTIWLILIAVWWIFYVKYAYDYEFKQSIFFYVAHYINRVAAFLLNLFGYDATVINTRIVTSTHFVNVGKGCVGLQVFHVFTFIIILMVGRVIPKLIYIVFGLIFINFLNVIRVMLLYIYMGKHLKVYDGPMNAHSFYNNVVYVIVVILWLVYILYYHPKVSKYIEKRKLLKLKTN